MSLDYALINYMEDKIKELEDRIKELERRPVFYPVYQPVAPQPINPPRYPSYYEEWCCGGTCNNI